MAGHTLLTGGAGFIGSTLARHLLAAGHRLVVLDKLTYAGNRENLHGLDLELVVGDVCDKNLVRELVAGAEVVIHAAAESHVTRSHQNAAPFIRSNIEGSRVIIQSASNAQVPHCIHLSTDEVFGPAAAGQRFGFDDTHRPSNAYAASKASAEAFLQVIRKRDLYPFTLVRMTNNYGPRQHEEKAIPCWINHALQDRPVPIHGHGTAERDWLHVDDFAQGITKVLAHGTPGETHHFSGGNSRTNRQVAEMIAKICGAPSVQEGPERPGQDARYALNDDATRAKLNWKPTQNFETNLLALVQSARKKAGS
jgi:dTDP-glucose 4,6-dehydratase